DCNPDGTITLQQGDIKTCTVTNNDISAKLIVNKIVINDNGGTKMISDFPLFVSGVQVVSGAANNVNAGTYAVSENNQTGYASIIGGDCGSDGSVTLALGETRTCTVTNDDVSPSLTVTKTVTNDNGGTLHIADFSFFIDANQVFSGIANWINAGMHTVSETPVFGYQGTIGGQCNGNGLVSLAVGDVKTCTINNDDIQPTLTVEKIVINDNGGIKTVHDFPLFIDNGIGQVSSGVANPVNAGTYAVSETNQTGYAQSFGGDCDENGSVALSVGQNKVCQIINNDIPAKLIVNKVVVNDNGGVKVISDFPLFIGGIQVTSGATNTVNAGTYTVSENNQSGYAGTFSGDCDGNGSVALQLGETKTCLITNDDKPGEIHGMKFEDKNGNGAKDEEDTPLAGWSIYLDANDNGILDSGEASTTTGADGLYAFTNLSSGTYNVREVSQNGWMQTYPDGDSHFKHAVAVTYGGSEENLNFGNFKLATVTGYKWDDKNGDGVWRKSCEGQSEGCVAEPGKQDVVVALGRQNGEPKQENGHETVPIEIIAMTLTGGDGGFIFHNVAPGHYKLFEEKKNGWSATNPAARTDSFFDITYDFKAIAIGDPDFDLLRVTGDPDFDLLRSSFFDVFPEFSGQNVIQSEATKGLLTTIPGVPLEFGNHKLLVLSQEAATETKETSTVISWTTDSPGTSRVIYDTVSHPTLGSAPNYGYANSTAVFDESPKVTSHNVSISGLVAGTTYYYRTISAASPESVSSEGSFGTSASSSDGGSSGSSGSGGGGDSTGILIQNTGGGGGGGNYSEGLTNNAFSGGSSIALETIPPVAVALNAGTENTNDGGALLQQNQESFSGTIGNGQNANSKTGAGAKNNVLQQTAINKPETPQSKPQNTSLLAAIGSGITLGTGSIIVGLIVLLVLFGGGAFLIRKRWFI
ncbi:fibronectin type III domain-containing protein, partial [Patescibacteria group bacterium]|nr:fibronectin type III domain-containing protein [Patescibacteria group bacterium]